MRKGDSAAQRAARLLGKIGARARWEGMTEDERRADRAKAAKTLRRKNRQKAKENRGKNNP